MIFLGDIHGDFSFLMKLIENDTEKYSNCNIIQVGDFGIGFDTLDNDEKKLQNLNDFLSKHGVVLYTIFGNHDNKKFFRGNYILSNLKLMRDYSVVTIDGYKVLFCGGAISVDRKLRIEKMKSSPFELYWENEAFELKKELLLEIENIDIIVNHSSPSFAFPYMYNKNTTVEHYSENDLFLKNDLINERNLIAEFWNLLCENSKPQYYFYGHFHTSHTDYYDDCKFVLLDINETYYLRDK